MKFVKIMEKIHTLTLFVGVAIIPVIFFPFVSDTLIVSKTLVLFAVAFLLLLTKTLTIIPRGRLELSFGKYDKALGALTLAYLVSGLLRTPSKMDFLVSPGTGTVILSGFFIYYFLSSLTFQDREKIKPFLIGSSLVVAIFSTLTRTGILTKLKFLPEVVRSASFSLAGDSVTALVFLLVITPWVVWGLINAKNNLGKIIHGAVLVILVLGATAAVMSAIPTPKNPGIRLPSLGLSWSVAVDTLKEDPLMGAGPANYLSSFKKFRPASYNKTKTWMVHYATARNFYLTAITETGLLGILGLGFVLILYVKELNRLSRQVMINWKAAFSPSTLNFLPLTLLLLLLLVFPGTITLLVCLFVFFALINEEVARKSLGLTIKTLPLPNRAKQAFATKLPAILLTTLLMIVFILLAYVWARVLLAEIEYKKALDYISLNSGQKTYETMQKVTKLNPYSDKYRVTYAQVNLLFSSSILAQKEITTDQRAVVAQLSQQAVREAKAAVAINPEKASNWEILGGIYKAVMGYAQGADTFAVEAYTQAISLDPVNPNLRIALGSVYYAQKNWEKAIDAFKFAVLAKPDYPNAHYDLALAFRQKKEYDNAAAELKEALKLVPEGSEDARIIKKELENLKVLKETPLNLPSQTQNTEVK